MSKITAIVLTRNEEEMIADCLESLSFCSEIILVDSNSTDNTVALAKRFGAQVITDDSMDFSQKRNKGLSKCKTPWVLYVDADERVSDTLRKSIEDCINAKSSPDGLYLSRKNYYLGKNEWPVTESFLRLFRKDMLLTWEGALHETAKVKGSAGTLTGYLVHFTHRNLSSMLSKTIEWSEIEANLRFQANHPKMTWWRFPRVMLKAFYNSYISQKGFKVGVVGLIESLYQSFSIFVTYARLWELQHKNTS